MKYPLLETHDNGKLIECPHCKNEETNIEGDYCQICGNHLLNKCEAFECDGYKKMLPSNARYCPICGSRSSFYKANILNAWDYKEELPFKIEEPFEEDLELPFN